MKAISFLGFNPSGYKETTYLNPLGSGGFKTTFIQEALVEFYKPKTLYILLTKTAETGIPKDASEPTWETLQKRLADKVDLQPIKNVPETHSIADIWRLFEQLTECLQEDNHVLFDITNGFRSLPVLALIAVSYLRVVRQVTIDGLIHGAFEAKNQDNETPIFDLLPIVSLLEWTTATDQFIKTGNGQALASLLGNSDTATHELAVSIDGIAQGLQLLRPMDVMREAAMLPDRIAAAAPSVSLSVPPFTALLRRVEKDYGSFGLENPIDYKTRPQASLLRQLKMVEWYAQKKQTVQALSLAREWLPSLLCYHFQVDPLNKAEREDMELLLNGGKLKDAQGNVIRESPRLAQWPSGQKGKKLRTLWGGQLNLANLRNDVLHAGFRKNPQSAEAIVQKTEKIIDELKDIAEMWNLRDEAL